MELTAEQKLFLKGRAHGLKPVVMIGQKGVTAAVLAEIRASIDHHELIKVKIAASDRVERAATAEGLARELGVSLIQIMGANATFFKRKKKDSAFKLPAA